MTSEQWLGTAYKHVDEVPEERWASMMLTREQYSAMVHDRAERDRTAPKVGERAPDFVARRLSPEGKLTGESFQLASGRGRPIGLVFGSYT
jgi:hypothetical protein